MDGSFQLNNGNRHASDLPERSLHGRHEDTRATGNGEPWYLVSGIVKIEASTALADAPGTAQNLSMDFNPDTRNVEVSFGLSRPEDVQLQAFDTQGRLVATLLQGTYASGSHSLSVFSNRLVQGAGSLVFKLEVGGAGKDPYLAERALIV